MDLGWKFMLEAVTVYIVVIAATILVIESAGLSVGRLYAAILLAVNLVLAVILFFVLDRGNRIQGAATAAKRRAQARES